MEIYRTIKKIVKELVGLRCDQCGKAMAISFNIIELTIIDTKYHFDCLTCLYQFAENELRKINPDNRFITGEK